MKWKDMEKECESEENGQDGRGALLGILWLGLLVSQVGLVCWF